MKSDRQIRAMSSIKNLCFSGVSVDDYLAVVCSVGGSNEERRKMFNIMNKIEFLMMEFNDSDCTEHRADYIFGWLKEMVLGAHLKR